MCITRSEHAFLRISERRFIITGKNGYFRIELATAKIIGVLVLLIPFIHKEIKDMAYVRFGITFISAFIAHISSGDPISIAIVPFIFFGIPLVSFIYHNKSWWPEIPEVTIP